MQFHLERVNRKEITGATVRNYLKSINIADNKPFNNDWKVSLF